MQVTLLERMDAETRTLAILGALSVVFVIGAVFALVSSAREVAPAFTPEPYFPDLAARVPEARELTITTKDASLTLRRNDEGVWVLPGKDNYPARMEPLRQTLMGLAGLTKQRPATANPEWYKELNLAAPEEKGRATRIVLKDAAGKELANLLVGKRADLPDVTGLSAYYVRAPDDKRSWIARGTLWLGTDAGSWIVDRIIPIARERISAVTVTPASGAAYTAEREKAEADEFALTGLPEGRTAKEPNAANPVAFAIADLRVEDVSLASDFDFEDADTLRYRTFDGLVITARLLQVASDYWATFEARYDGQPSEADAAKSFDSGSLAADINRRAAGWAFKLPEYVGKQMHTKLEDLLEPLPAPPKPAAAAPSDSEKDEEAAPAPETPDANKASATKPPANTPAPKAPPLPEPEAPKAKKDGKPGEGGAPEGSGASDGDGD